MAEVDANIDPAKKGSYEFSQLETYGDLKKVIKSIALKQKGGKIGDVALDTVIGLIPGAGTAKTTFDFIKAAVSKPDVKKTNTWLDKLDIDDEMSTIVDDTVENGCMQMMSKSIEAESDSKPLEPNFNMNAKMVNYLKTTHKGRTVAGISEDKKAALKSAIKAYAREVMMKEENITGGGASFSAGSGENYATPMAFGKKGKGENRAVKFLKKMGWKVADLSLPKHSKMFDYKKIFEAVGEIKVGDKVKYENQEWEVISFLANGTVRLKSLKGLPSTNVIPSNIEKIKEMKLNDMIDQGILNEVSYGKFKKEVTFRTKSEQLHKAIREVKRKLSEIDRIVEYTSRMKQELRR